MKQYCSWSEFDNDMMLVRENCRLYNAPGTQVRHDCDVVFKFYLDESQKVLPQVCQRIGLQLSFVCDLHVISINIQVALFWSNANMHERGIRSKDEVSLLAVVFITTQLGSAFQPSNNNKWPWCIWTVTVTAYGWTHSSSGLTYSVGWQPPGSKSAFNK